MVIILTVTVPQQIRWWFINRSRQNKKGKKNGVLVLQARRRQPLLVYQAYMHLYAERIMPEVHKRYEEYSASAPDGTVKGKWAFTIEEVQRLYKDESDEVKGEVEAYRQSHLQDQPASVLTIEELVRSGIEQAQKSVRAIQK